MGVTVTTQIHTSDPFYNGAKEVQEAYMRLYGFDYKKACCSKNDFEFKKLDQFDPHFRYARSASANHRVARCRHNCHSGDFTMAGTEEETFDFINWFCDLPYRQKIFVAGNHDDCLYGSVLSGLDENCHYLCNSGISIDGVIFYGVPLFVEDALSGNNKAFIQVIPKDTDVLITHRYT